MDSRQRGKQRFRDDRIADSGGLHIVRYLQARIAHAVYRADRDIVGGAEQTVEFFAGVDKLLYAVVARIDRKIDDLLQVFVSLEARVGKGAQITHMTSVTGGEVLLHDAEIGDMPGSLLRQMSYGVVGRFLVVVVDAGKTGDVLRSDYHRFIVAFQDLTVLRREVGG